MLTRSHLAMLAFAALAVPASACIITTTDDSGLGGFGGNSQTTSSGSQSTGSNTTSTTASTGSGACTPPTGTGQPESDCDTMANFPSSGMCPAGGEPIAIPVCHKGHELYTAGAWEELQACFANLPTSADFDAECGPNASSEAGDCLNTVYNDACANSDADSTCDSVAATCTDPADAFDTSQCKTDLLVFSTTGLNTYVTCIDAHNTDACAGLHDTCMNEILSQ
jgi:hypothetical protein